MGWVRGGGTCQNPSLTVIIQLRLKPPHSAAYGMSMDDWWIEHLELKFLNLDHSLTMRDEIFVFKYDDRFEDMIIGIRWRSNRTDLLDNLNGTVMIIELEPGWSLIVSMSLVLISCGCLYSTWSIRLVHVTLGLECHTVTLTSRITGDINLSV